jgi:ferredoxin
MMLDSLQNACRSLLTENKVRMVIAYGRPSPESAVCPVFITRPEDADQLVWDDQCVHNLVTYLTHKEIRAYEPLAVVVKPCDERALVVLEQESQIDRSQLVVIGMACEGVTDSAGAKPDKCARCESHVPGRADIVIGEVQNPPPPEAERYAALHAFLQKPPSERIAYWMSELRRCIKCYACRQACPLCYCPQCLVDKNRPTCIAPSATLKGNFAWHITRAFHLAGRCVGCDECTRVCPAGIDLRLLNQSIAKAAEENFQYRAGLDPQAEPLIGSYSATDREDFIR